MRLSDIGYPVVVLSHRKREFLPSAISSLRGRLRYAADVIVVDDSGDPEHHQWLDGQNLQYSLSDPQGRNVGYLSAMRTVWEVSRRLADETGSEYVMLWEEDFILRRPISLMDMTVVMDANPKLAHLNLQRQPVYNVERRFGYMESHIRRGYALSKNRDAGIDWVARRTPFTTNPGLIRREVLDHDWPTRAVCDTVEGGAEPAMSLALEARKYYFGWLGRWNTPATHHIGATRKSGTGY